MATVKGNVWYAIGGPRNAEGILEKIGRQRERAVSHYFAASRHLGFDLVVVGGDCLKTEYRQMFPKPDIMWTVDDSFSSGALGSYSGTLGRVEQRLAPTIMIADWRDYIETINVEIDQFTTELTDRLANRLAKQVRTAARLTTDRTVPLRLLIVGERIAGALLVPVDLRQEVRLVRSSQLDLLAFEVELTEIPDRPAAVSITSCRTVCP